MTEWLFEIWHCHGHLLWWATCPNPLLVLEEDPPAIGVYAKIVSQIIVMFLSIMIKLT